VQTMAKMTAALTLRSGPDNHSNISATCPAGCPDLPVPEASLHVSSAFGHRTLANWTWMITPLIYSALYGVVTLKVTLVWAPGVAPWPGLQGGASMTKSVGTAAPPPPGCTKWQTRIQSNANNNNNSGSEGETSDSGNRRQSSHSPVTGSCCWVNNASNLLYMPYMCVTRGLRRHNQCCTATCCTYWKYRGCLTDGRCCRDTPSAIHLAHGSGVSCAAEGRLALRSAAAACKGVCAAVWPHTVANIEDRLGSAAHSCG
jgi:hypothetical protein